MSIIQTIRSAQNLTSGINIISLTWPTAFADNTYFVLIQSPELILTFPSTGLSPAVITKWVYAGTGTGVTLTINNPNGTTISSQVEAVGIVAGTQDNFNNFINRLTALDGVGAAVPSHSAVPTIEADINGLNTTLNQLTLTIQQQLNTYITQLQTLQQTVNELLGGNS